MNDPGQHRLWSIPGDGVLARQQDLVLLSSIDDRGFAESLLELLTRTSEAGGDGRSLADAIGTAVESHESWGQLQAGPAVVAFGPAGAGLAFLVSGTAFVEITTAHGTHRLAAGHPSMLLRSVVAVPVQTVRGSLGGSEPVGRTDHFTRLNSGTVRAGGLSYQSGQPGPPAPAPPGASSAASPAAIPGTAPAPGEPYRAEPYPEGPPPFGPGPAQPSPGEPASSGPPRQEPDPVARALTDHGLPGPARGEPGGTDPAARPAPYDLGFAEPDIAPPASAAQGPHGPAGRPAAEAPTVADDTAAEPEETPGAPLVLGIYCENGHFTDPDAPSCLVCGAGISTLSAPPQRGPRPVLGVLIRDDGAAAEVDGDYVIGRDPARDPSVPAGEARPLRVVDAESTVSRVHARIHLDGWKVLLTDLGSVNGTRVQQPGADAEQLLDPQVPVPLEHGARIFVGAPCLRYERAGSPLSPVPAPPG